MNDVYVAKAGLEEDGIPVGAIGVIWDEGRIHFMMRDFVATLGNHLPIYEWDDEMAKFFDRVESRSLHSMVMSRIMEDRSAGSFMRVQGQGHPKDPKVFAEPEPEPSSVELWRTYQGPRKAILLEDFVHDKCREAFFKYAIGLGVIPTWRRDAAIRAMKEFVQLELLRRGVSGLKR